MLAQGTPFAVSAPAEAGDPLRFAWDVRDASCIGGDLLAGPTGCDYAVVGTFTSTCPTWAASGNLYRFDSGGFAHDTGLDLVLEGESGTATVTVVGSPGPSGAVSDLASGACPAAPGDTLSLTGTVVLPAGS